MRDKEQHGFVFDPNPPYQIIESKYLSADELDKIERLEHALEIYWNKKRTEQTLRYVTAKYDIFDFLMGLGTYFGTLRPYHKYTLSDVYDTIIEYIQNVYPTDTVLQQMVAIDYYSYHKIRPKARPEMELPKSTLNKLIETNGLNKEYRYIGIPINFDFNIWQTTERIEHKESILMLRYSGTEKAEILTTAYFEQV